MPQMSKVELYAAIRRDHRGGMSMKAFFEGHLHAPRTLGGVSRSKVRYDNVKTAVARVLGPSRGPAGRRPNGAPGRG